MGLRLPPASASATGCATSSSVSATASRAQPASPSAPGSPSSRSARRARGPPPWPAQGLGRAGTERRKRLLRGALHHRRLQVGARRAEVQSRCPASAWAQLAELAADAVHGRQSVLRSRAHPPERLDREGRDSSAVVLHLVLFAVAGGDTGQQVLIPELASERRADGHVHEELLPGRGPRHDEIHYPLDNLAVRFQGVQFWDVALRVDEGPRVGRMAPEGGSNGVVASQTARAALRAEAGMM